MTQAVLAVSGKYFKIPASTTNRVRRGDRPFPGLAFLLKPPWFDQVLHADSRGQHIRLYLHHMLLSQFRMENKTAFCLVIHSTVQGENCPEALPGYHISRQANLRVMWCNDSSLFHSLSKVGTTSPTQLRQMIIIRLPGVTWLPSNVLNSISSMGICS